MMVSRICEKCGLEVGGAWIESYGVRICKFCMELWATGCLKDNPNKEKELRGIYKERA